MIFQEFNIRYILLSDSHTYYISVAQWLAWLSSTAKVRVCFPGGQSIYKPCNPDVNFFVKTNDGRDRRLTFAIAVVWSVSNVLVESLEHREASHHPVFMGNRPTIIHTFLALSTQWMSSPSRKWGHGVSLDSPRFLTPMVESFSADLLIAIESYWTEPHLEFCQTPMTKLLSESMWSTFRWLD